MWRNELKAIRPFLIFLFVLTTVYLLLNLFDVQVMVNDLAEPPCPEDMLC